MPPRKKGPSSSSSSSSRASKKSALDPQASRFGIQHFFDRHSQSQAAAVSAPSSPPIQNDSSDRVLPPPLPIPLRPSSSNVVVVNGDGESLLPASPEITKMAPAKRAKFSPGMIIKQSQDDGGDEITWKISPVNERLKSFTGKVLTGAGKHSVLGVCSKEKKCSDSVVRFEKLVPSSNPPVLKTSMGSLGDCEHHNGTTQTVSTMDEQSPFRTPPSALYAPGESGGAVSFKRPSGHLDQHHHKKALLELLDQVEDAITIEDSTSDILRHCSIETQQTGKENNTKDSFVQDNSLEAIQHSFHTSKSCSTVRQNVYKENGTTEKSLQDNSSICHSPITQKFLVLEVSEKHGDISISQKPFKVLRLFNELNGQERVLHLFDEWFYSITRPGDTVNVIGEFDIDGKCIVDRNNNLFILHPDILVSGSRVASSFSCLRRAVLDERLKSTEQSISALIGTMLHQIFQAGLLKDSPTKMFLEEYAASVLQKNVENLYACSVNENDMFTALIEMIPRMLNWISHYKEQASGKPSVNFRQEGEKIVNITEVVDIEEVAWAPRYGLKGMIDASLRVKMGSNNEALSENVLPLEFKTGKATTGHSAMEHQAQVILYTLLMSERYLKDDIDLGLLYYLHTDKTIGIKADRPDLVGIIMRRNDLATSLLDASTTQALPSMLQSPVICRSCRHLKICTVYHKAHGGNAESSGLDDVFDFHVKHLSTAHFDFLLHWDRLIDLEAKTSLVTRKELLCPNSLRREQNTSSIRSIILDDKNDFPVNQNGRFNYKFVCQDFSLGVIMDVQEVDGIPVSTDLVCTLKCGDYVILSTESGRIAIANGIIAGISGSQVTVSLSRRLRLPGSNPSLEKSDLIREIWRIDKDEFASSYAVMRFNLLQLFLQSSENTHLRKLIVDLEAPRFDSGCVYSQDPAISYVRSEKSLNDDQCRAIQKMLTAKDYALILGMPGTGKTSTMVHAVKALLIRGASILLTSYTNSAVDNLLLKLKAQNIDFIRIGRQEAVHDDIHEHCISANKKCSVDDIKQQMNNARVVGVTCLGINHSLLANKKFDICIMDEAGQTTLPVSLGPLMFASVFVLVGDHYQLPPLVKSAEAHENGMGKSLFCKLSEAHPSAISALQCQYRMCAGIMDLSNALIYGNRLRCGSSEIANAQLNLSFANPIDSWLREILDPKMPVVFINTDSLSALESRHDKIVNNPTEAYIVSKVTRELLDCGVPAGEIGIITPYNSQADLIRRVFGSGVEIHTIDRYQGRDKDCIVLSFVRSNEISRINASSLLGDWHRINVALTRAKKKLIMVGSCRTLSKVPLLKLLIEKVTENGHIFNMSGKDIHIHPSMELKKCSSKIQKLDLS